MFSEITSGLIGGLFGTTIAKILGRFRLWKVFLATLLMLYFILFVTCLFFVGWSVTLARFGEFFTPFPIKLFLGLSTCATFVAFLGRNAVMKTQGKGNEQQ